jgi:hypothetical protein
MTCFLPGLRRWITARRGNIAQIGNEPGGFSTQVVEKHGT